VRHHGSSVMQYARLTSLSGGNPRAFSCRRGAAACGKHGRQARTLAGHAIDPEQCTDADTLPQHSLAAAESEDRDAGRRARPSLRAARDGTQDRDDGAKEEATTKCVARLASVLAVGTVVLTAMPIFFAGNAIYPIVIMPEWLQAVSKLLTDQLDAPRAHMLTGGTGKFGLPLDCGLLVLASAFLIGIAADMYPRMTT
jgi:hypothetical protein